MLYVMDLDDTLYLEADYVRSGFSHIDAWLRQDRGIHGFFEKAWGFFQDGVRGTIFDAALSGLGVHSREMVDLLVKLYRAHSPDISLEPDALAFLKAVSPEELALVTDGPSVSQWAKIQALGLGEYFEKIIVTSDLGEGYSKPHTRAFLEAQGKRSPGECVYVGDNPAKDFAGPKRLCWRPSIRIRRERSLHQGVETPQGCREIRSLSEIQQSQEGRCPRKAQP